MAQIFSLPGTKIIQFVLRTLIGSLFARSQLLNVMSSTLRFCIATSTLWWLYKRIVSSANIQNEIKLDELQIPFI